MKLFKYAIRIIRYKASSCKSTLNIASDDSLLSSFIICCNEIRLVDMIETYSHIIFNSSSISSLYSCKAGNIECCKRCDECGGIQSVIIECLEQNKSNSGVL